MLRKLPVEPALLQAQPFDLIRAKAPLTKAPNVAYPKECFSVGICLSKEAASPEAHDRIFQPWQNACNAVIEINIAS